MSPTAEQFKNKFWSKWHKAVLKGGETKKLAQLLALVKSPKHPTQKQMDKVREFIGE